MMTYGFKCSCSIYDMVKAAMRLIDWSETHFKYGDKRRNIHCVARLFGIVDMMNMLGVDCEAGNYDDGDFERIGFFKVDGVYLVKNGEIDYSAFHKATADLNWDKAIPNAE